MQAVVLWKRSAICENAQDSTDSCENAQARVSGRARVPPSPDTAELESTESPALLATRLKVAR
jgi:hypothetical protein